MTLALDAGDDAGTGMEEGVDVAVREGARSLRYCLGMLWILGAGENLEGYEWPRLFVKESGEAG